MASKQEGESESELLTDQESAAFFKVGITRFLELEKRPDFPKAIWLGPRGKRRVRGELLAWALEQRREPA